MPAFTNNKEQYYIPVFTIDILNARLRQNHGVLVDTSDGDNYNDGVYYADEAIFEDKETAPTSGSFLS